MEVHIVDGEGDLVTEELDYTTFNVRCIAGFEITSPTTTNPKAAKMIARTKRGSCRGIIYSMTPRASISSQSQFLSEKVPKELSLFQDLCRIIETASSTYIEENLDQLIMFYVVQDTQWGGNTSPAQHQLPKTEMANGFSVGYVIIFPGIQFFLHFLACSCMQPDGWLGLHFTCPAIYQKIIKAPYMYTVLVGATG